MTWQGRRSLNPLRSLTVSDVESWPCSPAPALPRKRPVAVVKTEYGFGEYGPCRLLQAGWLRCLLASCIVRLFLCWTEMISSSTIGKSVIAKINF